MDKNVEKFIKLVQEHPDLPVVPMVNYEVVCSSEYNYWMGSFFDCHVGTYWLTDEAMCEDEGEFIQHTIEAHWNDWDELSDEEQYRKAKEIADANKTEAIIVYVDVPN